MRCNYLANENKNKKMRVTPHILLQKGDIIKMPWGNNGHTVEVVWLVEWYLLVEDWNNRFILSQGFYLRWKDFFTPIY